MRRVPVVMLVAALAAVGLVSVPTTWSAASPPVDPTYSGGAPVTWPFTADAEAIAVLPRSDGRTIVVGNAVGSTPGRAEGFLAYVDRDGTVLRSVRPALGLQSHFNAATTSIDGVILVAGFSWTWANGDERTPLLVTFTNDLSVYEVGVNHGIARDLSLHGEWTTVGGMPDRSFVVTAGRVTTSNGTPFTVQYWAFTEAWWQWGNEGRSGWITDAPVAVALDASARVLLATGEAPGRVLRLTSTAAPDPTFGGGDGVADLPAAPRALTLLPDQRLRVPVAGTGMRVLGLTADGTPDVGFGAGGSASTSSAASSRAVVLDPSGALFAVGDDDSSVIVAKYRTDGTLDSAFGDGGTASVAPGAVPLAAVAGMVDPYGLVVVGRWARSPGGRTEPLALRLRPGYPTTPPNMTGPGSIDPTYPGGTFQPADAGTTSVARLPDGGVVAVGGRFTGGTPNAYHTWVRTFSTDGHLVRDVLLHLAWSEAAWDVAVDAHGRILLAGFVPDQQVEGRHPMVARLLPDLTPDPSFATNGVDVQVGGGGYYWQVAADGDRLVASGGASSNATTGWNVSRWDASGHLDPTFGSGGRARMPNNAVPNGIAVDSQHRVVLGNYYSGPGQVVRLTPSGAADPTFGGGDGIADLPGVSFTPDLAIDGQGRIVVLSDRAHRLLADGSLDPSWDGDGTAPLVHLAPQRVSIAPDNSLVVAGYGGDSAQQLALRRLRSDGSAETSFGEQGLADPYLDKYLSEADDAVWTPNGIVVVGQGISWRDQPANKWHDFVLRLRDVASPQPTKVEVSSLTPRTAMNGWGPWERNTSNGEDQAGDGRPITIGGTTYATGLGAHAASDLVYDLPSGCTRFDAQVGVDDEVADKGSVVFEVWADGTRLVRTGTLTGTMGPTAVTADLTGRAQLRLVVTDSGNGKGSDHADWAQARLTCSTTPPSTTTTTSTTTTSTTSTTVPPTTTTTSTTVPPTGGVVQLSSLTPTAATNGWGPWERNLSNGEDAAGDGHTLAIGSTT
ncbi:MAG: glycoside hydrolase family 2 [Actinomycetia bacterium]|nr:glycoside hydrolase family 2 [Actinomycetes bacterium]